VGTVRAMWLAHREDRVDDMLDLIHPRVLWRPLSRPGRSLYSGHDGIRRMLEDTRKANGNYWLELDDITEPEPNIVSAKGRVVALDANGETVALAIELLIAMRDGLVHEVETQPLPQPPDGA
jgi:hypothetical protein